MASDQKRWKRIELPAELYGALERDARIAHVSAQALAAMLISRGLRQDAALAEIGPRERDRILESQINQALIVSLDKQSDRRVKP
jgi:hypothetical protein